MREPRPKFFLMKKTGSSSGLERGWGWVYLVGLNNACSRWSLSSASTWQGRLLLMTRGWAGLYTLGYALFCGGVGVPSATAFLGRPSSCKGARPRQTLVRQEAGPFTFSKEDSYGASDRTRGDYVRCAPSGGGLC
jgi:hypothetical protein